MPNTMMEPEYKTLFDLNDDDEIAVGITEIISVPGRDIRKPHVKVMTAREAKKIILENITVIKHGRLLNGKCREDDVYEMSSL